MIATKMAPTKVPTEGVRTLMDFGGTGETPAPPTVPEGPLSSEDSHHHNGSGRQPKQCAKSNITEKNSVQRSSKPGIKCRNHQRKEFDQGSIETARFSAFLVLPKGLEQFAER